MVFGPQEIPPRQCAAVVLPVSASRAR